jgi:hypothetical protein
MIEATLQYVDELEDPIGFWAATTCRWARFVEAPPRLLAPELTEAFRRYSSTHLDEELPQVLPCFRLMLPDGALFTEDAAAEALATTHRNLAKLQLLARLASA